LSATRELLRESRFDSLSVADILDAAGVSRASFYFYFPSKQAVLGDLVREAVAQGQQAARPWTDQELDPITALRAGVTDGARLWRENAGVLMAIVESWGSDEGLRELWLEQMNLFTEAATARIDRHLTDIMMAQDFHDLTGQVVAKVVSLAAELEDSLVKLLVQAAPPEQAQKVESSILNGPVVNPEGRSDVVANQGEVDDLLASLGF